MVLRRCNGNGRTDGRQEPGLENVEPQTGSDASTSEGKPPTQTGHSSNDAAPDSETGNRQAAKDAIKRIEDADRQDGAELDSILKRAMEPLLNERMPENLTRLVEEARKKLKK